MLSSCVSQGLFRIAPSASKLKKLKASLDCGVLDVQEYSADPHAIAGEVASTAIRAFVHFLSTLLTSSDERQIEAGLVSDTFFIGSKGQTCLTVASFEQACDGPEKNQSFGLSSCLYPSVFIFIVEDAAALSTAA